MKNHLWNMFASISNGQLAKKSYILYPKKKICESFLNILWNEGLILGYKTCRVDSSKLKIYLKYYKSEPVIVKFRSISKPGKREYYSLKQIWKIDSSKTFIVFSTNLGLRSMLDCKRQGVGGEPLVIVN